MKVQPITFKSKPYSKADKILLEKIAVVKKYPTADMTGKRSIAISNVLKSLSKEIQYIAYKKICINFTFSQLCTIIENKISDILSQAGSLDDKLKQIKEVLNFNPEKNVDFCINNPKFDFSKLTKKENDKLQESFKISLEDKTYKERIAIESAAFKLQRRNGIIPKNAEEFCKNFKKTMGMESFEDEKIYKMLEDRYDLMEYKNKLYVLKERADKLNEMYKNYYTREDLNKLIISQPEMVFYSTEYVTEKISANQKEFEKEGFSKLQFFKMAKNNTDLFSIKLDNLKKKFLEIKTAFKDYGIDYSNFIRMLEKYPAIFQRDIRKMFSQIDLMEKNINSKAFDRSKYIKGLIDNPRIMSTTTEKQLQNINETAKYLEKYDITRDEYIRALMDSITLLNLTQSKMQEKIEDIEKRFQNENIDIKRFIKAALRRSVILTYSTEKLESNINDFTKKYEKFGMTRKRALECAIKVPAFFYRLPDSLSENLDEIVEAFASKGLTTQIFINNIESNANILPLDVNKTITKIGIYYDMVKERFEDDNLSNEELWNRVLKKDMTYSLDRVLLSKLNYKMFGKKPLGKNNEPKILQMIRENPDKTYKIVLKNNEADREFADYITKLSIDTVGKNVFNIEYSIMRNEFIKLRDSFSKVWYEIFLKECDAEWNFYINSSDENLEKLNEVQKEVRNFFSNKEVYDVFKRTAKSELTNTEKRQLEKIIKRFEEEMNDDSAILSDKENEIAQKFNSYILMLDNKEVSRVNIRNILQNEPNPEIRKKAYEANLKSADLIAEDLREFAKIRNNYAKEKGYDTYFEYKLKEDFKVDLEKLEILLDDVYNNSKDLIKSVFEKQEKELKEFFCVDELKPYHYAFLVGSNPQKKVNDYIKTKEEVVDISKKAYKNMGWDIDKLVDEGKLILDLFPRKNKNTHGFCFGIDAGRDARILANLTNNESSIDTLNHELGHCVYTIGISRDLPFVDREDYPAMTEAVAMMMGDLHKRENLLKGLVPDSILEEFKQSFIEGEAKFISHCEHLINFEKEMYKNPDQDLKKLWMDLGKKYKNWDDAIEPDNSWALIPHYLSHPAYYQNYFRAALIKAQIYNYLGNLTENPKTAEILNEKLFKYGISMTEEELIENLTGKKLSAEDFILKLRNCNK